MKSNLLRRPSPTTLLARLIEAPDLVQRVRALPPQGFSALVRQIGVEDAGEIVAFATTDQLVAAFDEDLFANEGPGERETFDADRFVVWLEVLLEAGEDVVANRLSDLSENFVIQALGTIVMVLDHDELLARMSDGGQSALSADKALESSLSEEIDGYLLISRKHDGWDAALAAILALDRDHRALLERILDRSAAISSVYVDDLDALATVLSSEESLAEDVEADREDRRTEEGHVEPRAARSFLALARAPMADENASRERDPMTHAYFRDRGGRPAATNPAPSNATELEGLLDVVGDAPSPTPALPAGPSPSTAAAETATPFGEALQLLSSDDPQRFGERMEELAYLANVLVAGAKVDDGRLRPSEAAEAILATVALGAELEAYEQRAQKAPASTRATAAELRDVLHGHSADLLFRKACRMLTAGVSPFAAAGFLRSRAELDEAIARSVRGKALEGPTRSR